MSKQPQPHLLQAEKALYTKSCPAPLFQHDHSYEQLTTMHIITISLLCARVNIYNKELLKKESVHNYFAGFVEDIQDILSHK